MYGPRSRSTKISLAPMIPERQNMNPFQSACAHARQSCADMHTCTASFMRKGKGNQSGVPKRVYGHQGMAHPLTNRRNHWIGVWPFGTGPDQQKATGELHEKRKGNQSGVPKKSVRPSWHAWVGQRRRAQDTPDRCRQEQDEIRPQKFTHLQKLQLARELLVSCNF